MTDTPRVRLFDLFFAFACIGAMTFGGGMTMIPFLEKELIEKRSWISREEMLDYYAIGQCTPGIIAVNTATFVGSKLRGVIGSFVASLGVVAPSVLIIVLIAPILTVFAEVPAVKSAFAGIRVCVCVLILNSVLKLWKSSVPDKAALVLSLAVFIASVFWDISPIICVVLSAVAGIIFTRMGVRGR